MKAGMKGAILASAVAVMFAASIARADESASSSSGSSKPASVKCVAGNDCKGQGSCRGGNHDCKGQNSCKGKGWVTTSSADECTAKGGHVEN